MEKARVEGLMRRAKVAELRAPLAKTNLGKERGKRK